MMEAWTLMLARMVKDQLDIISRNFPFSRNPALIKALMVSIDRAPDRELPDLIKTLQSDLKQERSDLLYAFKQSVELVMQFLLNENLRKILDEKIITEIDKAHRGIGILELFRQLQSQKPAAASTPSEPKETKEKPIEAKKESEGASKSGLFGQSKTANVPQETAAPQKDLNHIAEQIYNARDELFAKAAKFIKPRTLDKESMKNIMDQFIVEIRKELQSINIDVSLEEIILTDLDASAWFDKSERLRFVKNKVVESDLKKAGVCSPLEPLDLRGIRGIRTK